MDTVLFRNETFTSKTIWPEKLMVMWIQVCSNRDLLGSSLAAWKRGAINIFILVKKKSCKYLLKH